MPLVVDGETRLSRALALHPDVLDYIVALNPHDFSRLRNPLMRKLMPPRITLSRIAQMTKRPVGEILLAIHDLAALPLTAAERASLAADSPQPPLAAPRPPRPEWTRTSAPVVVDLLPSDERLDADPMPPINRALNTHPIGTVVLVKHKWEPAPLYDVWDPLGIEHFAEQVGPEEWWVHVRKTRPKER